MPYHPAQARKLLKKGRAVAVGLHPFAIRLRDWIGGEPRPLELKIDPGSRRTGLALMPGPLGFAGATNADNFFIARKDLVRPLTGDDFIGGITLRKTIDLCRTDDIPVSGRNHSLVDTCGADETFLTGPFSAQAPVFVLDGRAIGGGEAGPMFRRIRCLFKAEIAGAGA